jgi:hypothetical protein
MVISNELLEALVGALMGLLALVERLINLAHAAAGT